MSRGHAVISPSQFQNIICRPCHLCDLSSVPRAVACIFSPELGEPWDGAVCGTLMFMAPEVPVHGGHMFGSSIKSTSMQACIGQMRSFEAMGQKLGTVKTDENCVESSK